MIDRLPLLALIALSFNWGYSWIVLKIALEYSGPFDFAALRTLFGAVSLLLVLAATGRPLKPQRVPELFLLGCVQTAGYVALSMWALVEGGAGRTAILVFTMPFWTVLLAWPLLGERIRGLQWLALTLAATGLIIILQPWNMSGSIASKLLAIAAGLVWAVSSIMVKRLQRRSNMDLLSLTTWQMLFGTLPLLLLSGLAHEPAVIWSHSFVLALLFNAVITMALGWWLWLYVLSHLPAGLASMSALAIPVIAILASSWHLGERPQMDEVMGMGLITVALLILSFRAVRQHRELTTLGQE